MPEAISQYPYGEVTPELLASVVVNLEKALDLFKAWAALTSTTVDDTVIAFIKAFVTAAKPYVAEPWVVALINFLVGFFVNHPVGREILEKLR